MIELLKLLIVLVCLKFIHIFSFYSNGLVLFFLLLVCCLVKLNPIKLIFKLKYFLLSIFIIYPLSIPGEIIINVMNCMAAIAAITRGTVRNVRARKPSPPCAALRPAGRLSVNSFMKTRKSCFAFESLNSADLMG